jgi:uncharacterized protein
MVRRRFLLSIDGGGIRGIVPALVLAEIEKRTEARVAQLFDLVAGTSTGGILTLGLLKPGGDGTPQFEASELVDLYAERGDDIFHDSLLWKIRSLGGLAEERYDEKPLEKVLKDYFGDARLSEALTEFSITSYDLYESHPFFMKRSYSKEKPEWDYPMWWAARATSAAPTYFEPFEIQASLPDEHDHVLVDGGVFANNPTVCGYVDALEMWGAETEIVVCSLGTGEKRMRALSHDKVSDWGAAKWATTILDTVFDGVSDTVDYQMKRLCKARPGETPRYRRFQIQVPDGMSAALDNATPDQIKRLRGLGEELIRLHRPQLDEMCQQLVEPRDDTE